MFHRRWNEGWAVADSRPRASGNVDWRLDDNGRAMTDMPLVGSQALVARSVDYIDDLVHVL